MSERAWKESMLEGQKTLSLVRCQLTQVFTDIFNSWLNQGVVPSCFMTATVIQVPKIHYFIFQYCPVVSTLIKAHISRQPRPVQSVFYVLHLSLAQLEEKNTQLSMLFQDFTAAFNTIIPHHLVNKLGLGTPLCKWLLDFPTNRQLNWCGLVTTSLTYLSTSSPRDFVLSPLLFILMTNDFCARIFSNHINEECGLHWASLQEDCEVARGLVQLGSEYWQTKGDHLWFQKQPALSHNSLSWKERTEMLRLSMLDKKSSTPFTQSHHFLERDYRGHTDQLLLCLV